MIHQSLALGQWHRSHAVAEKVNWLGTKCGIGEIRGIKTRPINRNIWKRFIAYTT